MHDPNNLAHHESWGDLWMYLQKERGSTPDASHWDERSKTYTKKDSPSEYVSDFLRLAQIPARSSVLDMGCGVGHLAIPLAQSGCKVIAADFSMGMLARLNQAVKPLESLAVTPLHMSWEEDWEARGLSRNCVDIAIASRSMAVSDLRSTIAKMTWVAQERCIATVCLDHSPRIDERIFDSCDIDWKHPSDGEFLANILEEEGFEASMQCIRSERSSSYDSFEDAVADYRQMIDRALLPYIQNTHDKHQAITRWLASQLVDEADENGKFTGKLTLKEPRVTTWAFIQWPASAR